MRSRSRRATPRGWPGTAGSPSASPSGSACFLVGPFPGFVQLVGPGADGVVFFAGSVFFTLAAGLELRESTVRLGRWAADSSWWSAAVQFAGTLFFNLSTFARHAGRTVHQAGEPARLVAGRVRVRVLPRLRGARLPRGVPDIASGPSAATPPGGRRLSTWPGCVLFGIAAIASFVVPSSGSILDLAASNWCTALGALCFLIGAVRIYPRTPAGATT